MSATQTKGENEPIQTNQRVRDVLDGVPPHVESKLSHARHTRTRDGTTPFVECMEYSKQDAMEGFLLSENLGGRTSRRYTPEL